uniref:Chitin-binding type-2 domain-containing protein n=1 Tax=Strigamia maritima TaxID=126957 RepID=T1IS90_STRMM
MAARTKWRVFRKRIQFEILLTLEAVYEGLIDEAEFKNYKHRSLEDFINIVQAMCDENCSEDKFDEKINQLAMTVYSGGSNVTFLAGRLIPHMARILDHVGSSLQTKVFIIQYVTLVSWKNAVNQNIILQSRHYLNILSAILVGKKSELLCRWACYSLVSLMIGNVQMMKQIRSMEVCSDTLKVLAKTGRMWKMSGWSRNYAQVATKILGENREGLGYKQEEEKLDLQHHSNSYVLGEVQAFPSRSRLPDKYWSFRTPLPPQSKSSQLTCTNEGFFRHPDDCKKFYRCVDFSGEGRAFTIFRFDCAPGTVFDESISVCNHPSSVPFCEEKFGNEINPQTSHPDRPSALSSTPTADPEVKTEGQQPCSVHQTTMQSTATQSSGTKRPLVTTGSTKSPSSSSSRKPHSTTGSANPRPTAVPVKPTSSTNITPTESALSTSHSDEESSSNTQCTCGLSNGATTANKPQVAITTSPNHLSTTLEEEKTPASLTEVDSTNSQTDADITSQTDEITNAPAAVTASTVEENNKTTEDDVKGTTDEEDKGTTDEEDKETTDEEDKGTTDEEDNETTDEEDTGTTDEEEKTTSQHNLSTNELDSTTASNSVSPFDEQNTSIATEEDSTNSQVDGISSQDKVTTAAVTIAEEDKDEVTTNIPTTLEGIISEEDEDKDEISMNTPAVATDEDNKEETSTEKEETTTPGDDFFLFQLQCGNRPGYRRHPLHCHRYYKCSSNGVQITFDLFTCDDGQVFDNAKEKCLPKDEAEPCNVVEDNNNNRSWKIQRPVYQLLGHRTQFTH